MVTAWLQFKTFRRQQKDVMPRLSLLAFEIISNGDVGAKGHLAVTRAGECKSVSGHEGCDEASFEQDNTSD
jgi:hypothetical protein